MSKIGSVDWKLTYIWHTLQFSSSYVRGRNPPSHVTKQATRVPLPYALPPVQMLEGSAESRTAFPYGHLCVRVCRKGEHSEKSERRELFTLKNRKQMCWREHSAFTSPSEAHVSADQLVSMSTLSAQAPWPTRKAKSNSVGAEKLFSCFFGTFSRCLYESSISVGNCWSSDQLPNNSCCVLSFTLERGRRKIELWRRAKGSTKLHRLLILRSTLVGVLPGSGRGLTELTLTKVSEKKIDYAS